MRPHKNGVGIELESAGEAFALADAMNWAAETADPSDPHRTILGVIAVAARNNASVHIAVPGEDYESFRFELPEQMGANLARMVLTNAAAGHPNPLVRQAAADMNRSYEQHVFNDAMGTSPPEIPEA